MFAGFELGGTKCICVLAREPGDVLASEADAIARLPRLAIWPGPMGAIALARSATRA